MNTLLTINAHHFLSQNARESFQAAAARWGCGYVEFTEAREFHSSGFKLQAFDLCPHADRICVMDADTVIRHDAPNIFEVAGDPAKFYAVKNEQPHHVRHTNLIANRNMARAELECIFRTRGPVVDAVQAQRIEEQFFNSGFWVASREHHASVLALAWHYFWGVPGLCWWDQIPLNVAVVERCGGYTDLGEAWNYQFPSDLERMTAHVYHFAGNPQRYDLIQLVNWRRP